MVDQNSTPILLPDIPLKLAPNLGLVRILKLLIDIKDLDGKIFAQDIEGYKNDHKDWLAEINPSEDLRPKNSHGPLNDHQIYLDDLSILLYSIYQDIKKRDVVGTLEGFLENPDNFTINVDRYNSRKEYFNDLEVKKVKSRGEDSFNTFTKKEITEVINKLIDFINDIIIFEKKDQEETEEKSVDEEPITEEKKEEETPPRNTSFTSQDDDQDSEDGGDESQDEKLEEKAKEKIDFQKISTDTAFIYNRLAIDLGHIYGIDPSYFKSLPITIKEQINEQILNNVLAAKGQNSSILRYKIEQQTLQQILIYNQFLNFQIQQEIIAAVGSQDFDNLPALKLRIEQLNSDENFLKKIDAINDLVFENFSDKEVEILDQIQNQYQEKTFKEHEDELIKKIGEINPQLLENPATIININRLVDAKIATRQGYQDVINDPDLFFKSGINPNQQEAIKIRELIARSVQNKRIALSHITGQASQKAHVASLTVISDLSDGQQLQRLEYEKALLNDKQRDITAHFLAINISTDVLINEKEQILEAITQQELEQETYFNSLAQSKAIQEKLNIGSSQQPIVVNAQVNQGLINGTSPSISKFDQALQTAAMVSPHAKAALFLKNNWKKILKLIALALLALVLLILFILTNLLPFLIGLLFTFPIGGFLFLNPQDMIRVGNFTIGFAQSAWNWIKGQASSAWNSLTGFGAGVVKGAGQAASLIISKVTGATPAAASAGSGVSIATASMQITGAVLTTGVVMGGAVMGAFLQPDPVQEDLEAFSKYVVVSKIVNVKKMENDEKKDLVYTFTISPKENYIITPIINDQIDTLSYLGGDALSYTAPLNCVKEGVGNKPIAETKKFTCTIDGVSGTDVMMLNSFNFSFTVDGIAEEQSIKTSASTRIGDPELGCFEFGEAGRNFTASGVNINSIEWEADDMGRIMNVFEIVANNAALSSKICTGENVVLYRLPQSPLCLQPLALRPAGVTCYGGWKISADIIGLYDLGVFTENSATYTLIHELGHIIDARNSDLLTDFAKINVNNCLTYPYGCPGVSEAFPEAIALYVVHPFYLFSNNFQIQIQRRYPSTPEYSWVKDNIFGGEEY